MKSFGINIKISHTTVGHLLGGLASSYRNIPASAPESVSRHLKHAIIDILAQLELQGEDVLQPRSPFRSYAKLVKFERWVKN